MFGLATMSQILQDQERDRLTHILMGLRNITDGAHSRRVFIEDIAHLGRLIPGMNLPSPSSRLFAWALVGHCERFGQLPERPKHHSLGALLRAMLNLSDELNNEDASFIAGLILHYSLITDTDYLNELYSQYPVSGQVRQAPLETFSPSANAERVDNRPVFEDTIKPTFDFNQTFNQPSQVQPPSKTINGRLPMIPPPNDGDKNNLLSSLITLFREKPWSIPLVALVLILLAFFTVSGKIGIPGLPKSNTPETESPEKSKVTVNLFCTWKSQGKLTKPIEAAAVTAKSARTGDPINVLGKGIDSDGRISFEMEKIDWASITIRHPDIRDSQIQIPNIKVTESDSDLKKQNYTVSRNNCYFDAK